MKWSSISLQQKSEAVFFDETDYLYCGGTAGNCSADVHTGDARQLLQMIQTGVQTISNHFIQLWFCPDVELGHTIGEYQRHTQDLLQLFAIAKT